MEEKPLPQLIRQRAERILKYQLEAVYTTYDPNIVRCVGVDGSETHVNLKDKKEIPTYYATKQPEFEVHKDKPIYNAVEYSAVISREDIAKPEKKATKPKPAAKTTAKKAPKK